MSSSNNAQFFGYSLFASAFESSTDAMEINDMEGVILYVNDAWWKLFQRDRRVPMGTAWDAFEMDDAAKAELKRTWKECLSRETSKGMLRIGRADTSVSYVRTLHRTSDDVPSGVVTVYREFDAVPGEDVAFPVHRLAGEIRNVLTTINGILVLNENESVDDQAMLERVRRIAEAVKKGMESVGGV